MSLDVITGPAPVLQCLCHDPFSGESAHFLLLETETHLAIRHRLRDIALWRLAWTSASPTGSGPEGSSPNEFFSGRVSLCFSDFRFARACRSLPRSPCACAVACWVLPSPSRRGIEGEVDNSQEKISLHHCPSTGRRGGVGGGSGSLLLLGEARRAPLLRSPAPSPVGLFAAKQATAQAQNARAKGEKSRSSKPNEASQPLHKSHAFRRSVRFPNPPWRHALC